MTDDKIPQRICGYCLLAKPKTAFIATPAGFRSFIRCLDCDERMGHPTSPSQAQRIQGPVHRKTCATCDEIESIKDFVKDSRQRWSGKSSYCKTCVTKRTLADLQTVDGRARRRQYEGQVAVLAQRKAARRERRLKHHKPSKYSNLNGSDLGTRERKLMQKYGLTLTDYQRLSEAQNNVCAICRQPNPSGRPLAVDHCHVGNNVRELLCVRCNTGIGSFRDSPELMEHAKQYLLKHRQLKLVI